MGEHGPARLTRRRFLRDSAAGGAALGSVALGGAAALLSACEGGGGTPGDDRRARTVRFDLNRRIESPELWNPLAPGFRDDSGFNAALCEPLFMLNYETGEIEPWLGLEFTSNDTLDVWTLRLRDGVTWSDGEAFDADDVVFTTELLRTGPAEINFGHAIAIQRWVAAVRAVDPLTVEFTLTAPNPRFQLDHFAVKIVRCIPILPEHIWAGQDPLTFQNYDLDQGWPVFTGPYKLTSTGQSLVTWERDPEWWGVDAGFQELPAPEFLEFEVAETEEVRVARAGDNEFDVLDDVSGGAFETLRARNERFVSWYPELPYAWEDPCTRLFSLNNAVEPWNDRDLRWAVNFAVDKDQIVEIAYEGTTSKPRMFFPPYPPLEVYVDLLEEAGVFEEYPILDHDPDRARQLIESKGWTSDGEGYYSRDGVELTLQIDVISEGSEGIRLANVVSEQLQLAGIRTTLRRLAFATFAENLAQGAFEAAVDFSACGSVSEPWFSMDLFHQRRVVPLGQPADGNAVRWANAEYSRHVDAMAGLPLGDPRIEGHFIAAAREYLRDLPFFPAAHAKKLYCFNTTYWTGWATSEDNYIHPPPAVNSSHRIIHHLRPATDG
ncbi:ABC transporter substrate-binding protein [Jiangella asiatica]|nr:ABC transporter substrate-binding protein [Jiangella asiatica]